MVILFGFFGFSVTFFDIFYSKNVSITFTLSNLSFSFSLIKFDCVLFFSITSSSIITNFGFSSFLLDRTFEMLRLALDLRNLGPHPLLLHRGLISKTLAQMNPFEP